MLVSAIADLLSPLTQALGTVGDRIRVYRQENAIRAIALTRQLAMQRNVDLKPVPPKFLFDWVEKVSLEEPEDASLQEAWAGLLLSVAQKVSPLHFSFKRAISEFTKDHLDFIMLLTGGAVDFSDTLTRMEDFPYCFRTSSHLVTDLSLEDDVLTQVHDWALESVTLGCRPAKLIFSATSGYVPEREKVIFVVSVDPYEKFYRRGVVESLISYGFLSLFSTEFEFHDDSFFEPYELKYANKKRGYLEFTVVYLTPLGRRFVMACNGRALDD